MCIIPDGAIEEDGDRLFSVVLSDRMRSNAYNLKCSKYCLNIKKTPFFNCSGSQLLEQGPERLWSLLPWR